MNKRAIFISPSKYRRNIYIAAVKANSVISILYHGSGYCGEIQASKSRRELRLFISIEAYRAVIVRQLKVELLFSLMLKSVLYCLNRRRAHHRRVAA